MRDETKVVNSYNLLCIIDCYKFKLNKVFSTGTVSLTPEGCRVIMALFLFP